jgi:hypothetical protein
MAPEQESIRIGMQLRFAVPPDRRDPRILYGQPQDQPNHVVGDWRAPAARLGLRPFARHQPAVPAQDRGRGDKETRPPPARERAAKRREYSALGGRNSGRFT